MFSEPEPTEAEVLVALQAMAANVRDVMSEVSDENRVRLRQELMAALLNGRRFLSEANQLKLDQMVAQVFRDNR
jgi:hypothetical protein